MLMNDFYTLSDSHAGEQTWNGTIRFRTEHPIFKGHFPGQPVVPGVCMMQIVKEVLESQLGSKLRVQQAAQVKFLQLITPETAPVMQMDWTETEDGITVNASFRGERDLFKMSARLLADNTH